MIADYPKMVRNYTQEYWQYRLLKDYNFDFNAVMNTISALGGSTGIEHDTAYLLLLLLDLYEPKKILEYGAGLSTIVFQHGIEYRNTQFISYEEKEQWGKITKTVLQKHGYKDPIRYITPSMVHTFTNIDMIFLDSGWKLRKEIFLHNDVRNIPLIILDDMEVVPHWVSDFFLYSQRKKFIVFDGWRRLHRQQLIIFPNEDTYNQKIYEKMDVT